MIKNLAAAIDRENKDDGGVMRPKNSLMTGFIGTAWISKALSDNGIANLLTKYFRITSILRGSIQSTREQHRSGNDLTDILWKMALAEITA